MSVKKTILGGACVLAALAFSAPLYAQMGGAPPSPIPSPGSAMPQSHDGPPPPDSRMTQPEGQISGSPAQGGSMAPSGTSHPRLPPKGINGPQNMMMPPPPPPQGMPPTPPSKP